MLAAAANSTSTATSGAFQRPHSGAAAGSRPGKKRVPSRAAPAEEAEYGEALADVAPASNTGNGGGETCSLGNGHGEAVVSPLKKGTLASLKAPKSGNKVTRSSHATDSSRARAQNQLLVGPVFNKSLFFVVLILGLATAFWNWKGSNKASPEITTAIQVKELEDFSKKTTKWMQVQLELVDMKIGKEIEGLRREVEDKMEEQALSLGTSIKNLKAQVEDMDSSLHKLMQEGLLSKAEGTELIQSILQQKAAEESQKALSLDDVRFAARQIVETELEKHSADGIGRVDYALGSGGGKVIDHSEGYFTGSRTSWLSILGAGLSPGGTVKHPMAHKVLEPSFGEPGQCLPLKGNDVFVEIALRTHIHPDSITIEHVPKSVAYDVKSAPKDFRVFGWLEKSIQADSIANPVKKMLLGEFRYSVEGSSVQTFSFPEEVSQNLINTVRVHVTSNHGSPSHTCIYRIRVHGFEPPSEH